MSRWLIPFITFFYTATSQAAVLPVYEAPFIKRARIQIDGRMNEDAWKKTHWTIFFLTNRAGRKNRERTRARIFYDQKYLYIGFESEDNHIVADMRARDDELFREDAFEIFLEPYRKAYFKNEDLKEYIEIEINPLNTLYDNRIFYAERPLNVGKDRLKFNIKGIQSAVLIRKTTHPWRRRFLWTGELRIPLNEIPGGLKPNMEWGMNLTRIDTDPMKKTQKLTAWSPTGSWFHVPKKFGRLRFVE